MGVRFLKVYAVNEEVHCSIVGWPNKKKFCAKSWHVIKVLTAQKNKFIRLNKRFETNKQTH